MRIPRTHPPKLPDTSGVNTSFFEGDITYYPPSADPDTYFDTSWSVANAALTFNGSLIGPPKPPVPGIFDSSGPFLLGPNEAVVTFYRVLNMSIPTVALEYGHYAFQCTGGVPDLNVGLAISLTGGDMKHYNDTDFYNMSAGDLAYGAAPAQDYVRAGYRSMEGKEGDWCWGTVATWGA